MSGPKSDHPLSPATRRPLGLVMLLLPLLVAHPGWSNDARPTASERRPSAALTVSVDDTPDAIQLRIRALGDVEPGSVEIRFAGRKVLVLARDRAGRQIRSPAVRLPASVVEDGASGAYEDDTLVMTLRKRSPAQAGLSPDAPEAAAR